MVQAPGAGRRGLGPRGREQALATGPPVPCQHPCPAVRMPRIRWWGVLPGGARRRPSRSSRVVGSPTWLAGPRVLCQGRAEASRSHGRWALLSPGWPFPRVRRRVQARRRPSPASGCAAGLRPAWGCVRLGVPSEELAGKPTARVHWSPAAGVWPRKHFADWRLGVTLSMFGAVVAAVTHRGSREGGARCGRG